MNLDRRIESKRNMFRMLNYCPKMANTAVALSFLLKSSFKARTMHVVIHKEYLALFRQDGQKVPPTMGYFLKN